MTISGEKAQCHNFCCVQGFWGAGEPLFVSALGSMPPALIRNISFRSINAVSENGALFSSLPLNMSHSAVHGIELVDVDITIRRTGNISRPKGKDYSPTLTGSLYPAIVPAFVAGMTFEGVHAARVVGGGVQFDGGREPQRDEQFWSMNCVNESGTGESSMLEIGGGWSCTNATEPPMRLELQAPTLVGASKGGSTHYWFPTNCAVAFNASHLLVGARLADDCSDYFCNKTTTHKPSDPSHQISMSKDGGQSFQPLYEVHGQSPWGAAAARTPFLGPCTLALNSTTHLVLYQGQIRFPWQSVGSVFSLGVDGLRYGVSERAVRYTGIDGSCGSGQMWNQGVIKKPIVGGGWLMSAQCDTGQNGTHAIIFSSTDGFVWALQSAVPVTAPAAGPNCESPGENTIVWIDDDGGLLLVARCGSNQPLLAWRSDAGGSAGSWRRHALPSDMIGVMPVAVRMDSGAVVLTTGRGGLALWLNSKGDGTDWLRTNVGAAHNRLVLTNRLLNGSALQYTDEFVNFSMTHETTAYSTLVKIGPDNGILCYDRLAWSTVGQNSTAPVSSWVGPPGNRDAEDHMFCMRFAITGGGGSAPAVGAGSS